MTRSELYDVSTKVTSALIADGWDYDNARFAVMTAVSDGLSGVLSDQLEAEHPKLKELSDLVKTVSLEIQKPSIATARVNSEDEMEDQ